MYKLKIPRTITSASFSAVPELFFNIKVYFPLSLLTARRTVNSVLRSYLSIVILEKKHVKVSISF